ncbi:YjcZ family sporulation protein [Chengkuizengella sp. SCS-71B]
MSDYGRRSGSGAALVLVLFILLIIGFWTATDASVGKY